MSVLRVHHIIKGPESRKTHKLNNNLKGTNEKYDNLLD